MHEERRREALVRREGLGVALGPQRGEVRLGVAPAGRRRRRSSRSPSPSPSGRRSAGPRSRRTRRRTGSRPSCRTPPRTRPAARPRAAAGRWRAPAAVGAAAKAGLFRARNPRNSTSTRWAATALVSASVRTLPRASMVRLRCLTTSASDPSLTRWVSTARRFLTSPLTSTPDVIWEMWPMAFTRASRLWLRSGPARRWSAGSVLCMSERALVAWATAVRRDASAGSALTAAARMVGM